MTSSSTIFGDIVIVLKGAGYIVNLSPQEKQRLNSKELVIIIDDLGIEVESVVSYIQTVTVAIVMNVKTASDVIDLPAALIETIEQGITPSHGFRFSDIKVDLLGTLYQVKIMYSYKEVLHGTE